MKVREARPDDVAAIRDIWNHYIEHSAATFNAAPKAEADVRAAMEANPAFLVACDPQVIGFATYFQFRGGVGYAHTMEHTIQLAPDAAGRGAGRALMTAIEAHARDRGVHSLWAGISAENPAAEAFHARVGFTEVARLPEVGFKFGRWMDLVLMQKRL